MSGKKPKAEVAGEAASAGDEASGFPLAVGTAAMQAWADLGAEAVRFVWDRLQQDLETQQALLACTDLAEMQKIQAEFFKSAQEQYSAETGKMLKMMTKAATAGLPTSTKRRYNDVPL